MDKRPRGVEKPRNAGPVTITIPGLPIAKGRPRLGAGGNVYTPDTTKSAEEVLAVAMRQACSAPMEGPLHLLVSFYFRYPKSWPKKRRAAIEAGAEPWHTVKPDTSNLVKLVEDAGNGIIWRDDAQIAKVEVEKVWSLADRTAIEVRLLDGEG